MHPDALIAHPKCNIFVEIKSGLYSETVMTVGNSEIFKNRVKEIIKGIQQAREASNYIRNSQNAPKSIKEQESEFLLLVTNVQLFIGNGLRLRDMLSDQDRSLQKKGDNERIPAKNIFLLTSDELEWLFAAARVNSLDLFAFLTECSNKEANPKTSVIAFSQRLQEAEIPYDCSEVVRGYYDTLRAKVLETLAKKDTRV